MLAFARTLRFRISLLFVAALALVIVVLSGLVYVGLQRTLLVSVDTNLRVAAERSIQAAANPDPGVARDERMRELALRSLLPSRLISLEGVVVQTDPLFPPGVGVSVDTLADLARGNARYETLNLPEGAWRLFTAPVSDAETRFAAIQVGQSLEGEEITLRNLRGLLIVLTPVALLFALGGGLFLAGGALAPIERVRRDVTGIIKSDDLSRRVSRGLANDEVGRLAQTFDGLLARVEGAVARERQFAADASHELRSPLTALKGELSLVLNRPRSADEYRAVLGELESSVDEMTALVEDLLMLARSAGSVPLETTVDLAAIAGAACAREHAHAESKRIALEGPEAGRSLPVRGDARQLQRAIVNLVENAVRYTPDGGHVRVRVAEAAGQAEVQVEDTGIGIAPEFQAHIFERFYRTEQARTRESGGSGLGLAIVQAIARRHGGDVVVRSVPGKGATFTLRVPLADALRA